MEGFKFLMKKLMLLAVLSVFVEQAFSYQEPVDKLTMTSDDLKVFRGYARLLNDCIDEKAYPGMMPENKAPKCVEQLQIFESDQGTNRKKGKNSHSGLNKSLGSRALNSCTYLWRPSVAHGWISVDRAARMRDFTTKLTNSVAPECGSDKDMHLTFSEEFREAEPLTLSAGSVTVSGGRNRGQVSISTLEQVRLGGLVNSGIVHISGGQDTVVVDVVNERGALVYFKEASALLGNLTNIGAVYFSQGSYSLVVVENSLGSKVEASNCAVTFTQLTNAGTLRVDGGSLMLDNLHNSGQIEMSTGEVHASIESNTGRISFGPSVTGHLYLQRGTLGVTAPPGVQITELSQIGATPTTEPSVEPSTSPSFVPSTEPSTEPTTIPSLISSVQPSLIPSNSPTNSNLPTSKPTDFPTFLPSIIPTLVPSVNPTAEPTTPPTVTPSHPHTTIPSSTPTFAPSLFPTLLPSFVPTEIPSAAPSAEPTLDPSNAPTAHPSATPTAMPSIIPTAQPSSLPTSVPTGKPTAEPSFLPSATPTSSPSTNPSATPTAVPSAIPTARPSVNPTSLPSSPPTTVPTAVPLAAPSAYPTLIPSSSPSNNPTSSPTLNPTVTPTAAPSQIPSGSPSSAPTFIPSLIPTIVPSTIPTAEPSASPSGKPSFQPSEEPTPTPSAAPSENPTNFPTVLPSVLPTEEPSANPSAAPSAEPSVEPTTVPSSPETISFEFSASIDVSGSFDIKPPVFSNSNSFTSSFVSTISGVSISLIDITRVFSSNSIPISGADPESNSFFPGSEIISIPATVSISTFDLGCSDNFLSLSGIKRGPPGVFSSDLSTPQISHFSAPKMPVDLSFGSNLFSAGSSSGLSQLSLSSETQTGTPSSAFSTAPITFPSSSFSTAPITFPSSAFSTAPITFPSSSFSTAPITFPSSSFSTAPITFPSSSFSTAPITFPSSSFSTAPITFPSSSFSTAPITFPSSSFSTAPVTFPSSSFSTAPITFPSSSPNSITEAPSRFSEVIPSIKPSFPPSQLPSTPTAGNPTVFPTLLPSFLPTAEPSMQPSRSSNQEANPSAEPSAEPSVEPSAEPTSVVTALSTSTPSLHPTERPSVEPIAKPILPPSLSPTLILSTPSIPPTARPNFQPSFQPSQRGPTRIPTFRPSSATPAATIQFDSTFRMQLTEPQLDEGSKQAVVVSTAESMGVDESNVAYTGENLLGEISSLRKTRRLQTTLYDIEAITTTLVSLNDFPEFGTDTTALYARLSQSLKDAVSSGSFTAALRRVSAELGATATLNVQDITVEVSEPVVVYPPSPEPTRSPNNPSSKSDNDLTDGEIAGIVIGSFFGFLLLLVGAYFAMTYSKGGNLIVPMGFSGRDPSFVDDDGSLQGVMPQSSTKEGGMEMVHTSSGELVL